MSQADDPYRSPESELTRPLEVGGFHEPRSVPAGHAAEWIKGGWGYFKKSPLTWVLIVVVWLGGSMLLSLIPGISLLINLVWTKAHLSLS